MPVCVNLDALRPLREVGISGVFLLTPAQFSYHEQTEGKTCVPTAPRRFPDSL